ncbi:LOW QUALITY PROTEIN: hypothetical protein U9M48_019906, partial [Paspalum notatum var. saurae]
SINDLLTNNSGPKAPTTAHPKVLHLAPLGIVRRRRPKNSNLARRRRRSTPTTPLSESPPSIGLPLCAVLECCRPARAAPLRPAPCRTREPHRRQREPSPAAKSSGAGTRHDFPRIMASSKAALTASNTGFMPVDAAYEILLRVPAKDLCRFRAVCRPWRSLLSDPHFIAAHAGHHPDPEPLIIASCYTNRRKNGVLCDVMDLSGRVVKQVPSTWGEDEGAVFTQQDLICTKKGHSESFRLLNPADGAVYALPGGLAEEHAKLDISAYEAQIAFGLVASTGEYKVFRVLCHTFTIEQRCEILMLDGSNIHSPWRAKDNPTNILDSHSRLVIDGIVYFFSLDNALLDQDDAWHCVASFDLQTEEWRGTILGPQTNHG